MATEHQILVDVTLLVDGGDLSPQISQFETPVQVETKEVTNFASKGWKELVGALKSAAWTLAGYYRTDDAPGLFAGLGKFLAVAIVENNPGAAGDSAYFRRGLSGKFPFGGKVGELQEVSLEFSGGGPVYAGVLLERAENPAVGAGAEMTVGAVPAGKKIAFAVHAEVETELEVALQSNASGGGPGDWLDRGTVNLTERGAGWLFLAGPLTDTRYRVRRATVDGDVTYHAFIAVA